MFSRSHHFHEILDFHQKTELCEKIINPAFSDSSSKKSHFAKKGPRAPESPKKGWNFIGFKGPGASGSRGTKKRAKLRKSREIFRVFRENADFYVKSWEFTKKHHFALSHNVGIPCKIQSNKPGTPRINLVPPLFL